MAAVFTVISNEFLAGNILRIRLSAANPEEVVEENLLAITNYSVAPGTLPGEVLKASKYALNTYDLTINLLPNEETVVLFYDDGVDTFSLTTSVPAGTYDSNYFLFPSTPLPGSTDNDITTPVTARIFTTLGDELEGLEEDADLLVSCNDENIDILHDINIAAVGDYEGILTVPISLLYGSVYSFMITLDGIDYSFSFETTSGVSKRLTYNTEDFYRQPVTQQMANSFPYESVLRTDPYSVGQTLLNVFAEPLQDLYDFAGSLPLNLFPGMADLNQLSSLSSASIVGFEFLKAYSRDGAVSYSVPTVYGYRGEHRFDLTLLTNNDVASLKNRLPDSFDVEAIVRDTIAFPELNLSLNLEMDLELKDAQHLFFLVTDFEDFAFRDVDNNVRLATLGIRGITERDIEDEERIPIVYAGIYRTSKKFRYVDRIFLDNDNVAANGTIEINTNPVELGSGDKVPIADPSFAAMTTTQAKLALWELDQDVVDTYGTILRQKTLSADTIDEYIGGSSGTITVNEYEMLDVEGEPLRLSSIAPCAFSYILTAIGYPTSSYDQTYKLYLFDKRDTMPSVEALAFQKTSYANAPVEIEVIPEGWSRLAGTTIPVQVAVMGRGEMVEMATTILSLTYWDVEGNETVIYSNPSTGTFVAGLEEAEASRSHTKPFFSRYYASCNLPGPGDYVFSVAYVDRQGNSGRWNKIFKIHSKQALAEYDLAFVNDPTTLTAIFLDGDQQLVLVDMENAYYYLTPRHDFCVLDFQQSIVSGPSGLTSFEVLYES
jgi:hypothetical protein